MALATAESTADWIDAAMTFEGRMAYIHEAVSAERSSADISDTEDAVPPHCGSPSVRRRFTEWDAAGAGAVFPHCVKIEDAAYAKAAFAKAALTGAKTTGPPTPGWAAHGELH